MNEDNNNNKPLTKGLQGWTMGRSDGYTIILIMFFVGVTIVWAAAN